DQIEKLLVHSDDYIVEPGETVKGYYAYPFGEDVLEDVLDVGKVTVSVPEAYEEQGEYDTAIGEEGKFDLSLSEDGEEKVSADGEFYEDKVTKEDMGDKEMISSKEDIDETEDLGDLELTLAGYQFAEFKPNEEEAPRFEDFTDGMVILTTNMKLENNGDVDVPVDSVAAKLTVNDGAQYLLVERLLLPSRSGDVVEPGESDEFL